MSFLLDLYESFLRMWTSLGYLNLAMVVWAMCMAISIIWGAITITWMTLTTAWMFISSMLMTIISSYDPVDLVFKLWLSIMMFVIFKMGTIYLRELKLQQSRSQQDMLDLHTHISNMQHDMNENNRRFADCIKHQRETDQRRYQQLLSMMQNIQNAQVPSDRVTKLKHGLKQLQTQKESAVEELNNLANNLDDHFSRIKKAKITGSAVAIGGTVLAIVGLALIPLSFGTSVIFSIAGGAVSGAGGITAGGSSIVESVLSSKRRKSAQKILDDYNSNIKEIKFDCLEIGEILKNQSSNVEIEFRPWCMFWNTMVHGASSITQISWNTIANPILNSLKLASVGEDVAAAGLRGASMAGRAITIVGGSVGILMLPLDIYTLVKSAMDLHKKTPHNISSGIRNIVDKLNKECPSVQEIDNMIEATFNRRTMSSLRAY